MDSDSEVIAPSEGNVFGEEHLRQFIETFETLPELWNPTSTSYKNKEKRNSALDKLLGIYSSIKPGANRADVKRKINTLRCNYRKELKKILLSKRSGSGTDAVYQPTSWVFYALQFLDKFEKPVNVRQDQQELDQVTDVGEGISAEGSSRRADSTPSTSSITPLPPPVRKRRDVGPVATQNELLKKACTLLGEASKSNPEIPTIAVAWGEKLNTLDPQQRAFAEKAINDIFFEASLGTLHRYSIQINQDSRYWPISSVPTSLENTSLNPQSSSASQDASPLSSTVEEEHSVAELFTNFMG